MSSEEWKYVIDYKGYYEVSNLGRVRSVNRTIIRSDGKVKTFKSVILKRYMLPSGYIQIKLSKSNITKSHYVHRLVSSSHLGIDNNKSEVNHIDGNKMNNYVTNLEWCTPSYNNLHAFSTGLRKNKTGSGNYNFKGTIQVIGKCGNISFTVDGPVAMREKGLTPTTVYRCLAGKSLTHKGYTYKRIPKEGEQ